MAAEGLEVGILADEPCSPAGDVKAIGALDCMLQLIDSRLRELVDLAGCVGVGVMVAVSARPDGERVERGGVVVL